MTSDRKARPKKPRASRQRAVRMPLVGAGILLEEESRRLFEQIVAPWTCQRRDRDNGIDLDVDILALTSDGSAVATGKRFAVQLKATRSAKNSNSRSIKTTSLRYWYDSTSPVLLAYILIPDSPDTGHPPTGEILYRWIDDELLSELTDSNPAWQLQEEVTVRISGSQRLDAAAIQPLKAYVNSGGIRRRYIPSGTYSALRQEALECALRLRVHAATCHIESVTAEMDHVGESLRSSFYSVALTGPARMGKSTLLNAIIGLEISPVGEFPTTAVPLILKAGPPVAEVHFIDGTIERVKAHIDNIRPFAEQAHNEDNRHRLRFIEVSLPNALLEQGIMLFDLPGLHDASDEVRSATVAALDRANAVVYILSAARVKDGEFSLDHTLISDLQQLQRSKDNIVVVLNKSGGLTPDERIRVSEYTEHQLRKRNLWDRLAHRPFFLDGRSAFLARQNGEPVPPEHLEFEKWLWDFLHATHSTGLQRLATALKSLHSACDRFAGLLALRVVDGAKAEDVEKSLHACRTLKDKLQADARRRLRGERHRITADLVGLCQIEVGKFHAQLAAISLDSDLPPSGDVRKQMELSWQTAVKTVWQQCIDRHAIWAAWTENEVNNALDKATEIVGLPHAFSFVLPETADFSFPDPSFGEAWGLAAIAALAGLLFTPTSALFTAAAGWIAGFFVGRRDRRDTQVASAVKQFAAGLEKATSQMRSQFDEKLALSIGNVSERARTQLVLFVGDAERQLGLLGQSLSSDQREELGKHEKEVREEAQRILTLQERLWSAIGTRSPLVEPTMQSANKS